MSTTHYKKSQIFLHWLTAVLLVVIIVLPLARNALAPLVGGMATLFMLHKSLAICLLIVLICRLIVLAKYGHPKLDIDKWQFFLARLVQFALYLFMFVMIFAGFVMNPYPISFFNLFSIPPAHFSDAIRGQAHFIHITLPYFLIALIVLHALAALYHHFIVKDGVLKSMLTSKE